MLLACVGVPLIIHRDGNFVAVVTDFRDRFSNDVVVLEGLHWQIDARKPPHFPGPQAARIDHHLGIDRALGRDDIPSAVRQRIGFNDRAFAVDFCAVVAGTLGIGMGDAGRIHMAVHRFEKGAYIFFGIYERVQLARMFQRNEIRIQAEIARLGPLLLQVVVTLPGGGEINPCLLYTSDAADDLLCVALGGRRHLKKKKKK